MARCRLPGERLFASGILLKLPRFYGLFSLCSGGVCEPGSRPSINTFSARLQPPFSDIRTPWK